MHDYQKTLEKPIVLAFLIDSTDKDNKWLNMWFFVVVKIDSLLQFQGLIDFHRNHRRWAEAITASFLYDLYIKDLTWDPDAVIFCVCNSTVITVSENAFL